MSNFSFFNQPLKVRDSSIIMVATGFYVACLIIANLTAGKLFDFLGIAVSVGAFAYMTCFTISDVLVDIYGPRITYRLVVIGLLTNIIVLFFSQLALKLPIISGQTELQNHFEAVFASTTSVIVASLIGYPITEVFEIFFWKKIKIKTKKKHMWLRNSIVGISSQLLDAMIFFNLAFFLLPQLFYGAPAIAFERWWFVIEGALLYGLWKGIFFNILDYPILRLVIPWIRNHRIADIPELEKIVDEEKWEGGW